MKPVYKCPHCGLYTEASTHCGAPAQLVIDGATRLRASKLLALALRHDPAALGVTLDRGGWADIASVLRGLEKAGVRIGAAELAAIAALDDKGRFEIDGGRIRARYGHSIDVDIEYPVDTSAKILYHGTSLDYLPSIEASGVLPMRRRYVHLAADLETACLNARRRPKPVVLEIDADCVREEAPIYKATQKILLTGYIPARCVKKVVIC
ncbi:MAG: RNA 2'-phosphotransferase [Pyrobaculum sp.]